MSAKNVRTRDEQIYIAKHRASVFPERTRWLEPYPTLFMVLVAAVSVTNIFSSGVTLFTTEQLGVTISDTLAQTLTIYNIILMALNFAAIVACAVLCRLFPLLTAKVFAFNTAYLILYPVLCSAGSIIGAAVNSTVLTGGEDMAAQIISASAISVPLIIWSVLNLIYFFKRRQIFVKENTEESSYNKKIPDICPYCKASLDKSSVFCEKCGNNIC